MQVHLLNLLKVVFFECNFSNITNTPESKEYCEKIFKESSLIDSIIKGMKNEVSFVRYHFIQFATTIMESMKKLLKAADYTKHITKLIECFCELMKHVDVSIFATQHQIQSSSVNNPDERG
jgi:predicted O-linked N-acetylglucosamine transferase (SPINDLY family)